MERHGKALLIAGIAHCLETLCHPLRITVFTALTDLGTSRDGIPSHVGPFNGRWGCHTYLLRM
jgi:hypothetical protein